MLTVLRVRPFALTLLLGLAACQGQPQGDAQPAPSPAARRAFDELAPLSATPARVDWDRDLGVARELAGDFAAPPGRPADAALAFLARHAALFGMLDGRDLVVSSEHESLVGWHVRLRQRAAGLEVHGVEVAVHLRATAAGARVFLVHSEYVPDLTPQDGRLGAAAAAEVAVAAALAAGPPAGTVEEAVRVALRDGRVGWRVRVRREAPGRLLQVVVADDGRVVEQRDLLWRVDGQGWVFDPNPIASTGNLALRDNNNADSPELTGARVAVTLPALDGSGKLIGPFVTAYTGNNQQVVQASEVFNYTRSQDGFEQVMVYFHIDRAARRLHDLGFTTLMSFSLPAHANALNQDNSFYDPQKTIIQYGSGGVDDAEDADVILHEYGHAIQDNQVPGFGTSAQAGAMGEGFGDFHAVVSHSLVGTELTDMACVAPWDATAYSTTTPPCLRRVDGTKHFPEFADNEVHDDGEIWSAAMWEAAASVGALNMLKEVVQSQYLLSPSATFKQSAQAIITTDGQLAGGAHAEALRRIFTWRGLLDDLAAPSSYAGSWTSVPTTVQSPHPYSNHLDQFFDISAPGAAAIRVHFSAFDTQSTDHVYLYDPQLHLYAIYSGTKGAFTSVAIPGDTVRVRLVTDAGTTRAGYTIDAYEIPASVVQQDAGLPDTTPAQDDATGPVQDDAAPGQQDAAIPPQDDAAIPPQDDAAPAQQDAAIPPQGDAAIPPHDDAAPAQQDAAIPPQDDAAIQPKDDDAAPLTDASSPLPDRFPDALADGSAGSDAGPPGDAAPTAPDADPADGLTPPPDAGGAGIARGCSCSTGAGAPAPGWLLLGIGALGLAARGRRRDRRGRRP